MKLTAKQRTILFRIAKIALSLALLFASTAIYLGIGGREQPSTIAFLFLIIVVLSSFFGDAIVGITVSIAGALCFDYFFLPPFGKIYIDSFSDWVALVAFLLASIAISYLTASAREHKRIARERNEAIIQIKQLSEWLIAEPKGKLSLSSIAEITLELFSFEYCSIHVYEDGKWQHYTGLAAKEIPTEIERGVEYLKDHPTSALEIAEEGFLGVSFAQVLKGDSRLAILAVKGEDVQYEIIETIAYLIGVRINALIKERR